MKFHLNYSPEKFDFKIGHHDPCFLIGSCFAENIGRQLQEHKFSVFLNPDGILFNPFSLLQSLNTVLEDSRLDEKLILERDGLFYSFQHHSSVHASGKKQLLETILNTQQKARDFLKSAKFLFITFGSAFVYEHRVLGRPVSNCHKQPGNLFEKKFLEPETIVASYQSLLQQLNTFNPDLKIIFTVSPVKYLKDGIEKNSLSKASLLLAVNRLITTHSNCRYFPAFELQNDDLRDYRFYREDLAHPNTQALDYIWEKFSECAFSETTRTINLEVSKLNAALKHRALTDSEESHKKHREFIEQQKARIRALAPGLLFD